MKREEYEARESQLLAPWAMRSAESRGRSHPEPEHALPADESAAAKPAGYVPKRTGATRVEAAE